jgi:large subunit ribosomal protein L25
MIVDLQAKTYVRQTKGDISRMRKNGLLPAVIYGHGEDSIRVSIEQKEFKKVLEIVQEQAITLNIKVEDTEYLCVIKAIQHNPATDQLLHVDFQHIHKGEKIKALVPIHIVGEAPGIKEGGILDHRLHEVKVRCLPADIPSHIDVDVSGLGLGKTIHIYDIKHEGLEFEHGEETPIVSVLIPRAIVEEVKPVAVPEGEEAVPSEEGGEKEEGEGAPSAKEDTKEAKKGETKQSPK